MWWYGLIATAVLGGVVGVVLAVRGRSSGAHWRLAIAYAVLTLMLASLSVYLYQLRVAARIDPSASFVDRLNILLPGFRLGSAFNDIALLASFFAVKRARACLVGGNAALFVLYYVVFMAV